MLLVIVPRYEELHVSTGCARLCTTSTWALQSEHDVAPRAESYLGPDSVKLRSSLRHKPPIYDTLLCHTFCALFAALSTSFRARRVQPALPRETRLHCHP